VCRRRGTWPGGGGREVCDPCPVVLVGELEGAVGGRPQPTARPHRALRYNTPLQITNWLLFVYNLCCIFSHSVA
jgi:hypothetical protein